jgi:hypothetical protein
MDASLHTSLLILDLASQIDHLLLEEANLRLILLGFDDGVLLLFLAFLGVLLRLLVVCVNSCGELLALLAFLHNLFQGGLDGTGSRALEVGDEFPEGDRGDVALAPVGVELGCDTQCEKLSIDCCYVRLSVDCSCRSVVESRGSR